jgi:hypothetical protein
VLKVGFGFGFGGVEGVVVVGLVVIVAGRVVVVVVDLVVVVVVGLVVDLVVVVGLLAVLVEGGEGRGLERWDLGMPWVWEADLSLGGPGGSEEMEIGRRGAVLVVGEGGAADPGDRRV